METESADGGAAGTSPEGSPQGRTSKALAWALDATGGGARAVMEEEEEADVAPAELSLQRSPSRMLPSLPSYMPHRTGACPTQAWYHPTPVVGMGAHILVCTPTVFGGTWRAGGGTAESLLLPKLCTVHVFLWA